MESLGTTVDEWERGNFMSAILASRQRLMATISNSCAQAIGADDADAAKLRLSKMEISLSPTGSLFHVQTDAAFNVIGVDPGQNLATYQMGAGITFNSSVNWNSPASTLGVDQNGVVVGYNVIAAETFRIGEVSMTARQFLDLTMLHELAHSFGQAHGDDAAGYQRNIWSNCFQ
jgi:hypothetical protein